MARLKTDPMLAKKVGKNIETAMTAKGLTKHGLAVAVGISQNSITHFVTGKGLPSVTTLLRISKVLDVHLDCLTN